MTQKVVVQMVLTFIGGSMVCLAALSSDGIQTQDVFAAIGAGVTSALALLKQSPNVIPPKE